MAAPKGNDFSPGRDTLYKPEYDEQARKLCLLLNATDKQLADFFGVNPSTIYEWKNKHPSFSKAVREGKDFADANVANSLYNRAVGGVTIKKERVVDGSIVELKEELAPDVNAAGMWLRARQPKVWRERTEQRVVLSDDFEEVMNAKDDDAE